MMERAVDARKDEHQAGVAGTEGGRRPTGVAATPAVAATRGEVVLERPEPEVLETPKRRRFTAEYKLRIVEEADRCTEPGQVGSLLRREGLYSSQLSGWRKQVQSGSLGALTPRKRGRKSKSTEPLSQENQQLRRQVERLQAELKKAHTIIDVQKKLSEMLGLTSPSLDANEEGE
jgi:transposase